MIIIFIAIIVVAIICFTIHDLIEAVCKKLNPKCVCGGAIEWTTYRDLYECVKCHTEYK